jgi:hypothetical protein
MQRTGDRQAQVGYSVAGRLGGRMTLCAVCTVHKEMRSVDFLVEPQNQGRQFISGFDKTTGMVCRWFGFKTTGTISPDLASKLMATVSSSLASKPVVSSFLV